MVLARVVPCLLALSACAPAEAAGGRAALVGATLDPDADAVVALIDHTAGALCTASFVSPHVLVTAKHCVQGPAEPGPAPASDFEVREGPDISAPTRVIEVVRVVTTPGIWDVAASGALEDLLGVDFAVVTVAETGAGTPLPLSRARPSGIVGRELLAWGYGGTPEGDSGHRYRGPIDVDGVTGQVVVSAIAPCDGDSGGPLVDPTSGDLIAVASLGPDTCGDGPGAFNLVDTFASLVDEAIALAGDCEPTCPDGGAPDAGPAPPDAGAIADAGSMEEDGGPPPRFVAHGGGGCAVAPGSRSRPFDLAVVLAVTLFGALLLAQSRLKRTYS